MAIAGKLLIEDSTIKIIQTSILQRKDDLHFKDLKTMANKLMSPMAIHKITLSIDYNKWLKRLDTQTKCTNQ